ncbi:MAG: O-acetyl-ADP-ribose deacetylase (regulator of RNase III) [Planctomycetota bacterium]|jgi:O-acetyl-ADP-ribose deacetylase (regulator of RNase III)
MLNRIHLVTRDIPSFDVDVIVNAANSALCGGGGFDGAIHTAGQLAKSSEPHEGLLGTAFGYPLRKACTS